MLCPTCRLHLRRSLLALSVNQSTPLMTLARASPSAPSLRRLYSTPAAEPTPSSSTSVPTASKSSSKKKDKVARPVSMTPGGSVLRGLGFLKTKPEVHAMEDEQYPDFLWGLLEPGAEKKGKEGGKGGDGAALSAKKRKKLERKQAAIAAHTTPSIPIHKQSIDLTSPHASATESLKKREEVTKAMRDERRKGIRQANFLRGM